MPRKLNSYDRIAFQKGLVYDYSYELESHPLQNMVGLDRTLCLSIRFNSKARFVILDSETYDLVLNFLESVLGE